MGVPRGGRSALAIVLAAVTVLSVVAVPTAGLAGDRSTEALAPGGDAVSASVGGGPGTSPGALAASAAKGKHAESPGKSGDAPGNGGDPPDRSRRDGDDDDDDDGPTTPTPGGEDAGPPEDPGQSGDAGPPDGTGNSEDPGTPAGPPERSNDGGSSDGDAGPGDRGNGPRDSSGPSVSVERGPPDRSGADDAPRGPPSDVPGASAVDVSVSNARSGDQVSVDVSPAASDGPPVAFERLSLTVRRDGDFTMRVVNSQEPLPGSPAFTADRGTEALGRILLEHSITNEDVESVSFVVRVSKDRLRSADAAVQDVALYRYADGAWTPLPTDLVAETETAYVYRVVSPGMSEFAVGAERTTFETYWADVGDRSVRPGESVRVSARVANEGGAAGIYEARLVVGGEVVAVRQVTVASEGTRQVNFRWTFDEPGTHTVRVGDATAGQVTVREPDGRDRADSVGQAFSFAIDRVLDVGRILLAP